MKESFRDTTAFDSQPALMKEFCRNTTSDGQTPSMKDLEINEIWEKREGDKMIYILLLSLYN